MNQNAEFDYIQEIRNLKEVCTSVTANKAYARLGLDKEAERSPLKDKRLFWKLRFGVIRVLSSPELAEVIHQSIEQNDTATLQEILRLLALEPVKDEDVSKAFNTLEKTLLENWVLINQPGYLWLSCYTLPALVEYFTLVRGMGTSITEESLESTIRRLGLVSAQPRCVRGLERRSDGKWWPIMNEKLRQPRS